MAQETRTLLKGHFETGDTPTQGQFANLIDSALNLTDDTLDQIAEGTTKKSVTAAEKTTWNGKVSQAELTAGLSPKLEASDIAEKKDFTQLNDQTGGASYDIASNSHLNVDLEETVEVSLSDPSGAQKYEDPRILHIWRNASGASVNVNYLFPVMDAATGVETSTKEIAIANGDILIVKGDLYYDGTNVRLCATFESKTP